MNLQMFHGYRNYTNYLDILALFKGFSHEIW